MKRLSTGVNLNPNRVPVINAAPSTPMTPYEEHIIGLSGSSPIARNGSPNGRNSVRVESSHLVFSVSPQQISPTWDFDDMSGGGSKKSRGSKGSSRKVRHKSIDPSNKVQQWRDALHAPSAGSADRSGSNGYNHYDKRDKEREKEKERFNNSNGNFQDLSHSIAALGGMADVGTAIQAIQEILKLQEGKLSQLRKRDKEKDDKIAELQRQLKAVASRAVAAQNLDASAHQSDKNGQKNAHKNHEPEPANPMDLERVEVELKDSDSEDSLEGHANQEVVWENYRIERAKRKQKLAERLDEIYRDWRWTTVSQNAFGAFIHLAFQEGFGAAMKQAGLMVFMSFLTQFTITFYLWEALVPIQDAPGHCNNPTGLQLAATGVWLLVMAGNIPGMQNACSIVWFCSTKKIENQERSNPIPLFVRLLVFLYAVASELVMWAYLLSVGCQFILTADNSVLIVRSTVAITFIQNIDEMVYGACAPQTLQEEIKHTEYKLHNAKFYWGLISDRRLFTFEQFYGKFLHLPFLILASLVITVWLRTTMFDCDKAWVEQQLSP